MLSTLVYTSLVLAPFFRVAAAFAVNSPEVSVCGDVALSWEPREAPYSVWVIDPEDPCGEPYVDLGNDHWGTTMTWYNAGVPAGMKVQIAMQDRNGEEAWSEVITVAAGSDSSCVPQELAELAPEPEPSSSSSVLSSSSSSSATGTTLVVAATPAEPSSESDPTVAPVAAGAAKDNDPFNAAVSMKSASTPLVLAGALFGALFVAL